MIIHNSGDHSLQGTYYGDEVSLREILGPFLEEVDGNLTLCPVTWIQGLEHYAERNSLTPSINEHTKFYATSLTLKDLRGEALAGFVRYWHNHVPSPSAGWFVQLDLHGGANSAVSAVPNSATSYAHRDKAFLIQFYDFHPVAGRPSMRDSFFLKNWVDATTAALQEGDYGMYANYSDSYLARGPAQKLYWGANLERLRQIKAIYDPNELFYYPQSIEPANLE